MAEIDSLVFKADTKSIKQGTADLDKMDQSAERLDNTVNNLPATFKNTGAQVQATTKSFGAAKNATQQLSYQLQDIAVMLQGGASPFLVLGTQGSQIASIFGPGGAVVGSLLSFGALIGGAVFSSVMNAESAVKKLDKALEGLQPTVTESQEGVKLLTKEFEQLAARSEQAAKAQLKATIYENERAFRSLQKAVKEAGNDVLGFNLDRRNWNEMSGLLIKVEKNFKGTAEQSRALVAAMQAFGETGNTSALRDSLDELFLSVDKPSEKLVKLRNAVAELDEKNIDLKEANDLLKSSFTDLDDALKNHSETADEESKKAEKRAEQELKRNERLIESRNKMALREQFRTESLEQRNADYVANIEASLMSSAEREKAIYEQRNADIESLANLGVITQEKADALMAEATKQRQIGMLSSMSSFFGQSASLMEQGFGKQNAVTRAAFAAQKLLAIPQMLVATEQGATMALGLGPIAGPIASAAIKAMGYASIGAVVGQTLAGRAQGGQVRPGESYVVGEKGPERLTMGSIGGRITPSVGSSAPMINVMASVKVIGGPGDAEVETTTKQISDTDFVVGIVVNQMKPGSRSRKQLESTSNVQGKGR